MSRPSTSATAAKPDKRARAEIIASTSLAPALQPIRRQPTRYSAAVQASQPARPVYSAISNPDPVVAANAAAATVQIIEYDAAAPAGWADEPAPTHYTATQPHDERIGRAQRLMALYGAVIDSEEEYGQLTGLLRHAGHAKRELTHMISHLSDLIAIIQRPEGPHDHHPPRPPEGRPRHRRCPAGLASPCPPGTVRRHVARFPSRSFGMACTDLHPWSCDSYQLYLPEVMNE